MAIDDQLRCEGFVSCSFSGFVFGDDGRARFVCVCVFVSASMVEHNVAMVVPEKWRNIYYDGGL